jgi:hypothetical protein
MVWMENAFLHAATPDSVIPMRLTSNGSETHGYDPTNMPFGFDGLIFFFKMTQTVASV